MGSEMCIRDRFKTVPIKTFLLSAVFLFKRTAPMNAIVKSILFKRNNAICIVFAINFLLCRYILLLGGLRC